MAVVGTVAFTTNDPQMKIGTWTVSSGVAAGNNSDLISGLENFEIIEYYFTVTTGYSSGTYTVAASIASDGNGLIQIDPGRHIRGGRSSATVNNSGYIILPPPTLSLSLLAAGTGVTAYTVAIIARAGAMRRVYPH